MNALILKRDVDLTPKLKAFTYQVEAVEAIKNLDYAAVFHEQGLGKNQDSHRCHILLAVYGAGGFRDARRKERLNCELAAGIRGSH